MSTLKNISLLIIIVFLALSVETNAHDKNRDDSLNNNTYDLSELVVFQKGDANRFTKKFEYNVFERQTGKQKTIEEYLKSLPNYDKSKPDTRIKNNFKDGKINLSFGSGVSLPTISQNSAYNAGINFQLNAMKVMSNGHAIRGDLQYSLNTPNSHYDHVKEGNLNTYAIKLNFLLGNFRKISRVNGYAILGGGLNIMQQNDTKFTYPEYNYNTMSYTGRNITYTQKNEADSFINLDCGGGLSYGVSDKYKIFAEAQYSFPLIFMGRHAGASLYGIFFGSPSLRVGAQIEL